MTENGTNLTYAQIFDIHCLVAGQTLIVGLTDSLIQSETVGATDLKGRFLTVISALTKGLSIGLLLLFIHIFIELGNNANSIFIDIIIRNLFSHFIHYRFSHLLYHRAFLSFLILFLFLLLLLLLSIRDISSNTEHTHYTSFSFVIFSDCQSRKDNTS